MFPVTEVPVTECLLYLDQDCTQLLEKLFTGTEKTGEQSESPTSVHDARRRKSSMVHLWRPRT